MLARRLLLLTLLLTPTCTVIVSKTSNLSPINDAIVTLLTTCYGDHLNSLIIAGKINDFYNKISRHFNLIPVILLDNVAKKNEIHVQHLEMKYVVVLMDTIDELQLIFGLLQKSNYWNNQATYFIMSTSKKNCRKAAAFLNVAWKINILSAIFLCTKNKDVTLYTYNPFTKRAPIPWREAEYQKPSDTAYNERWTLYKQRFIKDQNVCKNLNFVKTKFMDGYKIPAIAAVQTNDNAIPGKKYYINSLKDKLVFQRAQYFSLLFETLNVTPVINYSLTTGNLENESAKFLNSNNNEVYDISLNFQVMGLEDGLNVSTIATNVIARAALLTKHRGFLTPAEKLKHFYSINIVALTGLILIITFFVLSLYKKRGYSTGFFETFRLILDATFRGNLISFLTKLEHRRDVETVKDLQKLKFHIYSVPVIIDNVVPKDYPEEYIHITNLMNCSMDVIVQNTSVACLGPLNALLPSALNSHLHLRTLVTPTMGHLQAWVRKDWPLIKKINEIIGRLSSSGLIDCWEDIVNNPLKKLAIKETEEAALQIRKLTIQDLEFIFIFLVIGLLCSTIGFGIEILLPKKYFQFSLTAIINLIFNKTHFEKLFSIRLFLRRSINRFVKWK